MLLILYSIFLILFIIIAIFSFPQFSPIPYFPSNRKDLQLIIKALKLQNNQTVIDLGAGDGVVIFAAAKTAYEKKLDTKFIAVDINPVLLFVMNIKKIFYPNRQNIKIIYGDMFNMKFKSPLQSKQKSKLIDNITIYLYISPWYIEKVIKNLKLKIKNFHVVSYMYPIPGLQPKSVIKGKIHSIHNYEIS